MDYIRIDIFNKYLEIKRDLMQNLDDVYYRQNYYSRKYRGNRHTDINVAVGDSYNGEYKSIQIFVRYKGLYIKENIEYNDSGHYKSIIKSNLHEED